VRAPEGGGGEGRALLGDARPLPRHPEELADLRGVGPASAHPAAEARVVQAPAAHLADPVQDLLLPLRQVVREPFLEERRHRMGQAQDEV
jgi:hypothetical protein